MRYEELGVTNLTVKKIFNAEGNEITPGANRTGAMDYFVDLNRASSGNGKSPEKAFTSIASAITASNTSIGLAKNRWWARRNRIFVMGDGIDEDLTVLPEKTDIIGIGSDLFPFPRIIGNHAIALAKVGVRLINLGFTIAGTGDGISLPAGCHGFEMLDCFAHPSTTSTKFLEITDSAHVRIKRTTITLGAGALANIFAVAISIEGTAAIHDFAIEDCPMIMGTAGIAVANGTTQGSHISRNTIRVTTGLNINDDSDDVACIDNRLIRDDGSLAEAAFCDWNSLLAMGNMCASNTARNAPIPTIVVLTT